MIALTENQAYTTLTCVSKVISRKKQDLGRITRKLINLQKEKPAVVGGIKRSILERKKNIQDLQTLQNFLLKELNITEWK